MTVLTCKYCAWFRFLAQKIPRIKEDGWCVHKKKFVNSTDEVLCNDYWPSVPLVKPTIREGD
jgi:hypothetical protein